MAFNRGHINPPRRVLTANERALIRNAKPSERFHGDASKAADKFGVSPALVRKLWGPKRVQRVSPEMEREIITLLETTKLPRAKIGKKVDVAASTIMRFETPQTARGWKAQRQRSGPGFFNNPKKWGIVRAFRNQSRNYVSRIWKKNEDLFAGQGIKQEGLLAELELRLFNALQKFDMSKAKTANKNEAIRRFVIFKLDKMSRTILRLARNKALTRRKIQAQPAAGKKQSNQPVVPNPFGFLRLPNPNQLPATMQSRIIELVCQELSGEKDLSRLLAERAKGKSFNQISKETGKDQRALAIRLTRNRPRIIRLANLAVQQLQPNPKEN